MKVTALVEFTIQEADVATLQAIGQSHALEILESDGMRYAFADTKEEAFETIRKMFDDAGFEAEIIES